MTPLDRRSFVGGLAAAGAAGVLALDARARRDQHAADRLAPGAECSRRRDDGAAIVPGNPDASLLWQRITSHDPEEVMPPPESHKTVKPAEIALLRRWIAEGAKYEEHWAFIPPVRPAPPADSSGWARTPIDSFVVAKLTKEGLKPNPAEDRARLFRRLTLDLGGPCEVRAGQDGPDEGEQLRASVFFIVDEAQNLTPHEIKTIITRAGEGTKIIFTGDIQQIDHPYLDSLSNGLSYLINRMVGQPLYAHVTLEKGERSELAELASNLL